MKEIKNIFRDGNLKFKEITGNYELSQVLVVAVEVGKFNSKALIVNMLGDLIDQEIEFSNKQTGYNFFLNKLRKAQQTTNAKMLTIGMEVTGHYHENLAYHLRSDGFQVEILHSYDIKRESENLHAKNDRLDLRAIARMLLSNRARKSRLAEGVYHKLQTLSRNRRKLVRMRTVLKNKITSLVDRIFPGYWPKEDDQQIFSDHWGKASLLILEHYPHPEKILQLGVKRLERFLRKHNTKLGLETAQALLSAAENSLSRPYTQLDADCLVLENLIRVYRPLDETISELESKMAHYLLFTPGLYLLSIPGIGLVYAADFTADLGPIDCFSCPSQIVSLAGNVPRVYDSAQFQSQGLPLSKKGQSLLRATLNQIALSLNSHCAQFTTHYRRKSLQKKDRPGIAKIATGNKFVRLAFCLMKKEKLFVPEAFDPALTSRRDYYLEVFNSIRAKLCSFLRNDWELEPEDETSINYFSKIKHQLEEQHDWKLDLAVNNLVKS